MTEFFLEHFLIFFTEIYNYLKLKSR